MTRTVESVVTYLEMTARPVMPHPPTPKMKTAILRAENPPPHYYRYLYDRIGQDYNWVLRRKLSEEELHEVIGAESLSLYVLYAGGVPAGMAELDFADEEEVQLAYFGLMGDFIGQGLGIYFLYHTVALAWAKETKRLLVNTCTLDHPRALPLYQKMGFRPYAQKTEQMEVLEGYERATDTKT